MDPQTKLRQQGTQSAIAITGVDPVHYDPIVPKLTDVTELAVGGTIQGTHAHNPVMNTIAQNTPVQNPIKAPKRQTKSRAVIRVVVSRAVIRVVVSRAESIIEY